MTLKITPHRRADERIERSRLLYEQALFESDAGALTEAERELVGLVPWPKMRRALAEGVRA
jgi:hypothetical protein